MSKIDDAFTVLGTYGFTGDMNDRMNSYLFSKGYTQLALSDKLQKYGGFNKLITFLDSSPVGILKSSAPKVWFDPSDLSTLFQDSAGTIPVTGVEQPVGKMLDKSGGGYHATQATAGSRPTLTALKNLLLATDALSTQAVTTAAFVHTLSFTGTGTITLSGAFAGSLVGTGGNTRVSLTFTSTAASLTLTVSGSVTLAQLEVSPVVTRYQWVVTGTNYDAVGFPIGLKFDGIDDWMSTSAIDFSTYSQMTAIVGLRKLSDATIGCVAELGPDLNSTPGSWVILAPAAAAAGTYGWRSKGSLGVQIASAASYASPTSNIITGQASTTGDSCNLRINAVQAANSSADQGTGNYGNLALYLGRRGGLTFPASMLLYGVAVTGAFLSARDLSADETYMAGKVGILL